MITTARPSKRSSDTARLVALAKEIGDAYGASAEVLTADISDAGALSAVEARLDDRERPIDLLVNNAGFGAFGAFATSSETKLDEMIELNVGALTRLARAYLPGMIERGQGHIMNVASTAAFQPGPLMAVYYATKAYVLSLSEALAEETRGSAVTVKPSDTVCAGSKVPEVVDARSSVKVFGARSV